MEKVYVVTRYWDNNEGYPEDFSHHTDIFRVFKNIERLEHFFTNSITSHDILGDEYNDFDIISVEHKDCDDGYTIMAHYYCEEKNRREGWYCESRNITFEAYEMELLG